MTLDVTSVPVDATYLLHVSLVTSSISPLLSPSLSSIQSHLSTSIPDTQSHLHPWKMAASATAADEKAKPSTAQHAEYGAGYTSAMARIETAAQASDEESK